MSLNPPPRIIPQELQKNVTIAEFFKTLTNAVYTIFFAIGGQNGKPTIPMMASQDTGGTDGFNELTNEVGNPTTPATFDVAPDGYIKMRVGTQSVMVPYWNE